MKYKTLSKPNELLSHFCGTPDVWRYRKQKMADRDSQSLKEQSTQTDKSNAITAEL